MSPEQIEAAYPRALEVFGGTKHRLVAAEELHSQLRVNRNSADAFFRAYASLRRGIVFKRQLSLPELTYFLDRIGADAGAGALAVALEALQLHIAYRESSGRSQRGNRQILALQSARLETLLSSPASQPADLGALEELFADRVHVSLRDSSEARRKRLIVASPNARKVARMVYVYERNADVVADVLLRACGCCEGCQAEAPFTRKSDGTPYLEVHHRIPLATGGEDTVENAIALCPNCHRRSHFGVFST